MSLHNETIRIRKGTKERFVPKLQWDNMLKNKSTYGWELASDIPKEVLSKEKEITTNKTKDLLKEIEVLKEKNLNLEVQLEEKQREIDDLRDGLSNRKANKEATEEIFDLGDLTSKQLKERAKNNKIKGYSSMTKDKLIKALS